MLSQDSRRRNTLSRLQKGVDISMNSIDSCRLSNKIDKPASAQILVFKLVTNWAMKKFASMVK